MFAVLTHSSCRNDVVRSRPGNRIRRLFRHHIVAISRNPGMAHWPRDRVDVVALSPQAGPYTPPGWLAGGAQTAMEESVNELSERFRYGPSRSLFSSAVSGLSADAARPWRLAPPTVP